MGEIVRELDRRRIDALRSEGRFFWTDVQLTGQTEADLREVLGIPEHALRPLLAFGPEVHRSRKFHADGDHVVFTFSCFVDAEPLEVHVLVSGDYVLTVHPGHQSLPDALEVEPPEGRSEQYVIYAVLEAMLATEFDQLSEVDDAIEDLQEGAFDVREARIRNDTLRAITSDLTRLRRQVAPQRGTFARVGAEIGRVRGLEADSERYFDNIGNQINRLVDSIDAANDSIARLIDLRVNETTYWLTVVATVFLPLTFVTGFFVMTFGWMIDRISSPIAFFVFGLGGCTLGVVVTLYVVSRRRPVASERSWRRAP